MHKIFLVLLIVVTGVFSQKPSVANCGKGNLASKRIFHGNEVPQHKWPWMAAQYLAGFSTFRCQGAIISEKNILTSGQ